MQAAATLALSPGSWVGSLPQPHTPRAQGSGGGSGAGGAGSWGGPFTTLGDEPEESLSVLGYTGRTPSDRPPLPPLQAPRGQK